jgi:hypothetical protein
MSEIEREYEYRPKRIIVIGGALVCAVGTVFMVTAAMTNERGLIINRIIELDSGQANALFWALAALFFVGLVVTGIVMPSRRKSPQRIAFTADYLIAPKPGLWRREVVIDYANITKVDITAFPQIRERLLEIRYTDGRVTLSAGMLPNKSDLDEVYAEITSRMKHNPQTK